MRTNYGIKYCESIIRKLEDAENKLFDKFGHGFYQFSQENMTLIEYKRLLRKFKLEYERGLAPSYRPHIHGCFNN